MKASDFFSLPPSLAGFAGFFRHDVPPWEWLKQIGAALAAVTEAPGALKVPPGVDIQGKVWLHPSEAPRVCDHHRADVDWRGHGDTPGRLYPR